MVGKFDVKTGKVRCVWAFHSPPSAKTCSCSQFQQPDTMPINPMGGGHLPKGECAASVEYEIRPGESRLWSFNMEQIWDYMKQPIIEAQEG